MIKLFTKIPAETKRSLRYEVRLTASEAEKICTSAKIRNLSVAEFIRRTSLGRRADVSYDTEIVLALRDVTQAIRRMHADLVDRNMLPEEIEEWRPVIEQATAAMVRISK